MRHTWKSVPLCLTERGGSPPVKYGVTDPQLTGYSRDMTRFDEKCSLCESLGGNRAKMSKSARFVNKKGEFVKQRCRKRCKSKRSSKKFEELAKFGKIERCHVISTNIYCFAGLSPFYRSGPKNIAKLGLVPSTEVVQRISIGECTLHV